MGMYDILHLETTNINSDNLKDTITKNRENLIISFIGRVSTGKSSIINNILGIDLLPVASGQTTMYSIFISGNNDNILQLKEGDGIWTKFESIDQVKDYLLKIQKEKISKIEINLPISTYKILEKCTLIDNPAIGYSDELDEYVLNQCHQSCDLYVLVIDAVASISSLEKKFFSELNKIIKISEIKILLNFTDCIEEAELSIALNHHNRSIKNFFFESDELFIFSGYAFTQSKTKHIKDKQNMIDSEEDSATVNEKLIDPNLFVKNSQVFEFLQNIPSDEEIEQICDKINYLKLKNKEKDRNVNIVHNINNSRNNSPEMHNTQDDKVYFDLKNKISYYSHY